MNSILAAFVRLTPTKCAQLSIVPKLQRVELSPSAKGVRSLFFVFGTLSVTFRSLFLTLLPLFRHFFARLLLPDSFCGRVTHWLRGPAAILFISRDTCSDSIAKLFRACFYGYRTIITRYVAKWGIAQMCLCKIKYQGGVSHHFVGALTSLKKYRAIWGIAAILSQYRAIWGH